jgi:hypothetical protein
LPFWLAVLSLVVMILGSFGPWIRALFVSVSGTEGDGLYFAIGAAIALGSLWVYASTGRRAALIWPILLGAGVAADSARIIYEVEQESRAELFGEEIDVAQVLWGLYATLIAGAAVTLLCLYLALQHLRPTPAAGSATRTPIEGRPEGEPLETGTVPVPAQRAATGASQEQRGSRRTTAWVIAGGGAALALALGVATGFLLGADTRTRTTPAQWPTRVQPPRRLPRQSQARAVCASPTRGSLFVPAWFRPSRAGRKLRVVGTRNLGWPTNT